MLTDLETILDRAPRASRETLEDELRSAARTLLDRQFLYADSTAGQRRFDLLRRHRDYYWKLFDALGLDFIVDEPGQCVGIKGREGASQRRLALMDALFLLALRAVYEERLRSFSLKEAGRCDATLSEVWGMVEERTGRERPSATRCRSLVDTFARNGLLAAVEQLPDGDMAIEIRPAIVHAVSTASSDDLQRYARGDAASNPEDVDEASDIVMDNAA